MDERSYELLETGGKPIKAWVRGVPMDDKACQQLANVAALPFVHKWVAAMPDVHVGIGATVGSVIATEGAVIPAAVGVDIGCGMMATRTTLKASDLPDSLADVRAAIEKAVPHGRTSNGRRGDRGAWGRVPEHVASTWRSLEPRFRALVDKHRRSAGQHGEPPGHAGDGEPLHRALPGRGGSGVGDAAQRIARHR